MEILEQPLSVPPRFSLSARAARGILRRADKRGRTIPERLSAALSAVAGDSPETILTGGGASSLSGLGSGGPDDNERPGAGRLVVAPTLREHPRPGSNDDGAIVVARTLTSREGSRHDESAETHIVAAPLTSGSHPNSNAAGRRKEDDENLVAYPLARRGRDGGSDLEMGEANIYNALRAGDGSSSRANHVLLDTFVRRLTPTECERLQGFPDGWTAPESLGGPGRYLPTFLRRPWPNRHDRKRGTKLVALAAALHSGWRHMHGVADSIRYAALGDAVTTTVPEWAGTRMRAIDERDAA